MVDSPGRSAFGPDRAGPEEEDGWGSPVPADYGSLRAVGSVASILERVHGNGSTAPAPPEDRSPAAAPAGSSASAPSAQVSVSGRLHGRRRPAPVRSRASVRHVDIASVIKVSVIFWSVMLAALVVASVLLWIFADAFGSLPSIEKSVRTLFSLKSFTLHPGTVALYTAAGGLVIAVAGTLANIVFALIYNLIAEMTGGVEVELDSFNRD